MKLKSKFSLGGAALACASLLPQDSQAGGIMLYEVATPEVGLASAGYAARAQDASTLFTNPGGMALLDGTQVQGGLQLTYGSVGFSSSSKTSRRLDSNDGGNAIGALPAGSFFVTTPINDRVTVGFGTFSYFGLVENYDDNWVGRYYLQNSALLGLTLMPAVSLKVNDWLSVGGGPNLMYGYLKDQTAVNNVDPRYSDGQLTLKDEAWGFGGIGGVVITPEPGTRIGFTYISQVKLDFSDNPRFSNLGPGLSNLLTGSGSINLGVTVPQSFMVGFFHEINEKWAVMADMGWQQWSKFGEIWVGVDTPAAGGQSRATTTQLHYQDTWHGAAGAQYKLSETWRFSGGVAYDSSAVSSADRTVMLPMGQTWRFGLGAEYQLSQKLNVGAGYTFAWSGNMSVDQGTDVVPGTTTPSLRGRVAGSYNDSWFSFLSLSATYKF
jgi:long-chain fatty acid transport protein